MKPSLAFLRDQCGPVLLAFAIALAIAQLEFVRRFENVTLDRRTTLRAKLQPGFVPRPLVIAIDDLSIEKLGRWPWPRATHGELMQFAARAQASVVAWDILFTEPDTITPANDAALVAGAVAARERGTAVVFGAVSFDDITPETRPGIEALLPLTQPVERVEGDPGRLYSGKYLLPPLVELQEAAHFGSVDTPPAPDGTRRVVPLLVRVSDRVYFSFALQAVLQLWKAKAGDVRVRLGDAIYIRTAEGERRIPIDETGGYLVNYRFGLTGARVAGYWWLLEQWKKAAAAPGAGGEFPSVQGEVALVGQIAEALSDNGPTPFSGHTPLVLVHANIIDNILRGDFARRAPTPWVALAGVLLSIGGLAAFSKQRLPVQGAFALGVPALYLAGAVYAWTAHNLWLPLVWPLLGFGAVQVFMISRRLIVEQRARAKITGMFGTYLSPALVKRMIDSGQEPRLGGHEENITAYFSDIQGFSSFSEKLPPDRLVALMNEYLTACTDIVQEEGGTLDKYIGDAVVAMFGAPIALPDHAYRACVATQRVHQQLGELRRKWQAEGDAWPAIVAKMQSRIGLNSGPCIIGNIGSRSRFNYTMMGDNVNLAARMESGAKRWGVYSMCTDATKLACEQHGGDRVVFRPLGRIVVMGRSQTVPIFEIAGLKETLTDEARDGLGLFEGALAKYYQRDWHGALAGFRRSAELEANQPGKTPGVKSNPSLVYLDITQEYLAAPPPENWDGVYVMKEK